MAFSLTYPIQPAILYFVRSSAGFAQDHHDDSPRTKGSRKLQFPSFNRPSPFSGGIISGSSTGGGTASGTGDAETMDAAATTTSTGSGNFDSTSGSGGYINTVYGSALGSSAAGGVGSQVGSAMAVLGIGMIDFAGTTASSGGGSFGAGVSPVRFSTVVTEIPGAAIPATYSPNRGKGKGKGGGGYGGYSGGGGFSPSTFVTTTIPYSTGPTGGFGAGNGALNIASTTTGMQNVGTGTGVGSSVGTATNFGGGMGTATNYFGTAGGLGSGTGSGSASGVGNTKLDPTNGIFTGTGGAVGNFDNNGQGIFGSNGVLAFP
jgi:hypothetical protein